VALTGTNLTGASAVNVSGANVSCSVTGSTATTVGANCTIAASAATGSEERQRDHAGGTSGNVTFTVTAPPAALLYFSTFGNTNPPGVAEAEQCGYLQLEWDILRAGVGRDRQRPA